MQTKKEFRYFTIFNHKKEEEYLRENHKAGWKFTRVNWCVYHFEKCEPEDVVYQLDYNKDGSAHLSEYIKMFEDCGWEYLQQYAEYSYFRKPAKEMNGEEEIFSDDRSRAAMMERVFKGRIIPLLVIFIALLLPSFVIACAGGEPLMIAIDAALVAVYLLLFARFAVGYYRLKNGK